MKEINLLTNQFLNLTAQGVATGTYSVIWEERP